MRWIVAVCLVWLCGGCAVQAQEWEPTGGVKQIAIWPGVAPDQQAVRGPERVVVTGPKDFVAGRPWTAIYDVTVPTITVYRPVGKNSGAAVVVFPGGGYQVLAIDLEGTEVCDWLVREGVTCVLLKYRVTDVGAYPKSGPYPEAKMALEDAQRAVGLVRFRAKEWGVDPRKIGVMGFSAGGHLVAAISNHWRVRLYQPVDAADRVSCRPDFAVAIYPGHLSLEAAEWDAKQGKTPFPLEVPKGVDPELVLNPDLQVTKQTPPTFLLQAEDDDVDSPYDSLAYFVALQRAGVPVEMHIYAQGRHAFGLRRTKMPITDWPELVDVWLRTIGVVGDSREGL